MVRPVSVHTYHGTAGKEGLMAPRVYVTRVIPRAGVDRLQQAGFDVDVNEGDVPLRQDDLVEKARSYDALVTLLTDRVDRRVLEAAASADLKIVANVAVGYDNVDVAAATDLGIPVTNTPGVLTETTADFAWALLMSVARRVPEAEQFFRAGKYHGWGILMLLGEDVHGKTLGIAGFGRIGQAVARRAAGFDVKILYYDPVLGPDVGKPFGAQHVELDTLLRESDFVSVHVPLTPETRHLISTQQLQLMKPTAYLINTSRGPVVDEGALVEALRAGIIKGAALDVFENEPLAHPGLLELTNVVLTPHIASASRETRDRMATTAADNAIAALQGRRPPNLVNPEVWTERK